MVINDEILAAYVDGTLPQDQVEEVRQYLASHPQELEQLVRVMDDYPRETKDEEDNLSQATLSDLKNSNIATSGAAFAAKFITPTACPQIHHADIQANLTHLLNELI